MADMHERDERPKAFNKGPRSFNRPPQRNRPTHSRIPEEMRLKIKSLCDTHGLTSTYAHRVVKGDMSLEKALELMARKLAIKNLMETKGYNPNVATQLVDKKITQEQADLLHRWHSYKNINLTRSTFDVMQQTGEFMMFGLTKGAPRELSILENLKYEFDAKGPTDQEPERIHKLRVKFIFQSQHLSEIEKLIKVDEEVRKLGLESAYRIMDRYLIRNQTLYWLLENKSVVFFTTIEGEILRGILSWFSKWEIGLLMKGGIPIILLRHAIQSAKTKEGVDIQSLTI